MLTRLLLRLFGLMAVTAGVLPAQQEVSLDDVTSAVAPPPPSGVQLHLYSDLDLRVDGARSSSQPPTLVFGHNHVDLLVQAQYRDVLSAQSDVFQADKLLEFTWFFAPGQSLRFGHLLIPFGEFNLHHLYGGRDDEQQVFLPELWTDTGASLREQWAWGSWETYLINGFAVPDGGGDPDVGMGGNPHNWTKAVGTTVRWDPWAGTYLSASALYHDIDQQVWWGNTVLYLGADAATRWGGLTLKAGGLWGGIWRHDTPTPQSWSRWGTYAEAKVALGPELDLRLRGGQLDPDSRVKNDDDQWNVNLALLWHLAVVDINVVLLHGQETWVSGAGPNNTDQLLVKWLVSL